MPLVARKRRSFTRTMAACAAILTLAVVGLTHSNDAPAASGPAVNLTVDAKPLEAGLKSRTSFAPMLNRISPSVVQIFTSKVVHRVDLPQMQDPNFRRFFEERFGPSDQKEMGLGSGVVVTADGYIVTNNHVIDGADEIRVQLDKSEKEYVATLIGTDPKTDVALLKIEAKALPAIVFADSDKLEVGDLVFAIGNPMGVGQTVTSGIISATGRGGLGITEYENYIQTDAAINRGNSGGALVDAEGRLVGINTAIISNTGGNQGIGLSVPGNLVSSVINRLTKYGHVVRGYLGVLIQPVTNDNARFFNLSTPEGAIVSNVTAGGPGELAGLKQGDVITDFNGTRIPDVRNLRLIVERTAPGEKVEVKLIRGGKPMTLTATLQEMPDDASAASTVRPDVAAETRVGMELMTASSDQLKQMGAPENAGNIMIRAVKPGSPAQESGLQGGDLIMEIDRTPVTDPAAAATAIKNAKQDVLLTIWRKGAGNRFLVLKLTS